MLCYRCQFCSLSADKVLTSRNILIGTCSYLREDFPDHFLVALILTPSKDQLVPFLIHLTAPLHIVHQDIQDNLGEQTPKESEMPKETLDAGQTMD